MISSILIANRGEIACRIMRTAKRLGIRTIAVYSDADAEALHVRQADQAILIGPAPARESYLVGEKLLDAARRGGAEAIHPGYGFLSENADFAQNVMDAGLIWIGASPYAIRAMGLKDAAKNLMAKAGVPVTPGYSGENQDAEMLAAEAARIGWPVLIKAVAGGGGKGMRLVERKKDFLDSLAGCKREGLASFGNDRVLIEKYIQRPRHIEVQVFGDAHGDVVHLFERDCSLQRRHQKVIEEAPAPGMSAQTREQLCAAALRAARAVNYVGAGTIEFIADASEGLRADRIWFMEMNTRLQVEHPVTEEITGVDLVEWQIRIASGERLPLRQDELKIHGAAIEARLYAEDPATGFLPSTGILESFAIVGGGADARSTRIETGVREGDSISSYYDPLIAKIITSGKSRNEAIAELRCSMRNVRCWPVKTNAAFLHKILGDPHFLAGDVDTGLIARKGEAWTAPATPSADALQTAAAHLGAFTSQATMSEASPWTMKGFRLNANSKPARITLAADGAVFAVELSPDPVKQNRSGVPIERGYLVVDAGRTILFTAFHERPEAKGGVANGTIIAPMPGQVTSLLVALGAKVTKGDRLLTLEAMKMEHTLTAPYNGIVSEINAQAGLQVSLEAVLMRITQEESA